MLSPIVVFWPRYPLAVPVHVYITSRQAVPDQGDQASLQGKTHNGIDIDVPLGHAMAES